MTLVSRAVSALLISFLTTSVTDASVAPVIGLGINSDSLKSGGALGALEPTLEWTGSADVGEVELSGGAFVQVQDVDKPSDLPFSLWGRVTGTVNGIKLSVRADTASSDLADLNLDVQASKKGTVVRLLGSANAEKLTGDLFGIQASHTLHSVVGDSSVNIAPSYNFKKKEANVNTAFAVMDTGVALDARQQRVTLTRNVGEGQVQPTFALKTRDFALTYKRVVGTGKVATTYRPNTSLGFTWTDGPWQGQIAFPMKGLYKVDANQVKFQVRSVVDTDGLY